MPYLKRSQLINEQDTYLVSSAGVWEWQELCDDRPASWCSFITLWKQKSKRESNRLLLCVYMCARICTCAGAYRWVWSPEDSLVCHFILSAQLVFEIGYLTGLELAMYSTLTGHGAPRSALSLPPKSWDYKCTCHQHSAWLFHMGSGDLILILRKPLYWLGYSNNLSLPLSQDPSTEVTTLFSMRSTLVTSLPLQPRGSTLFTIAKKSQCPFWRDMEVIVTLHVPHVLTPYMTLFSVNRALSYPLCLFLWMIQSVTPIFPDRFFSDDLTTQISHTTLKHMIYAARPCQKS